MEEEILECVDKAIHPESIKRVKKQSAVSHQLRVLKQAKLVTYRKSGKVVYYALADDHVRQIFEKGCEHIEEV